MDRYNQLFRELFKQPLSHEGSAGLLEKTIADYPYFTPAHFFLLHLTEKSSPVYPAQAKKTALAFNNNYWLNFQLLELKSIVSRQQSETSEPMDATPAPVEEPVVQLVEVPEAEPETTLTDLQPVEVTPAPVAKPVGQHMEVLEAEPETTLSDDLSLAEEEVTQLYIAEDISTDQISTPATVEEFTAITHAEAELKQDWQSGNQPVVNIPDIEPAPNLVENAVAEDAVSVPIGNNAQSTESSASFAEPLPVYTEREMAENEASYNETDLPAGEQEDTGMNHVSLKMAETLAGINLDKNTTEDTISFEPLHASDYFASVGIKLSEDIKPADKLGLQLRSFTEWLKTMKKVHAEQLADTSTSDSIRDTNDKSIQELAEASNKENEVLTEAMADVFQQQGKTGKAIEVYEKLSLLNPSKKVYFAAKIEQLKV